MPRKTIVSFVVSVVAPLLAAALLGGCSGPDYLMANAPSDPSAREERVSLHESEPPYTRHRAATVKPEIVQITIDEQFDMYHRAKILRAINEWNHVLNGFVRFDVDPSIDDGRPGSSPLQSWIIVPSLGGRPPPVRGMTVSHPLAVTEPMRPLGGAVTVYVDRVRGHDLANVMRHELGHVLGLAHDANGRLMSSRYLANHQQCIDRAAAEAIAANRKLPLAQLNWCGEARVANAPDERSTRATR